VLGRAEAFASKNGVIVSIMDALGMGLGFTLALVLLGGAREFLASGSLFQIKLIEGWSQSFMLMSQAPGAFILLGVFLGIINWMTIRRARKQGREYVPAGMDCRQCSLCSLTGEEE
jgi:electron transport complex protein RnfE